MYGMVKHLRTKDTETKTFIKEVCFQRTGKKKCPGFKSTGHQVKKKKVIDLKKKKKQAELSHLLSLHLACLW